MKKINTTTYTFEKLINEGNLYVDKTKYLFQLIQNNEAYFCSRPRRFGKSLAISTMEAIFKGKKELFKGLYIYDQEYDWQEYPVVHLDFAGINLSNMEQAEFSLSAAIKNIAKDYNVVLEGLTSPDYFNSLLRNLNQKYKKDVVLLIDEYDKPLLDHMTSPAEAEKWRDFMDNFYQMVKGAEQVLRFVFITGVTKFAKVSIFSKLNHLNDITMDQDYAEMFGYTQAELEENFAEYIDDAVQNNIKNNNNKILTREELLDELKVWYDGFKFSADAEQMYNPVSIGSFFTKHYIFNNYWFATGTPSFLMKLLKKNHLVRLDFQKVSMSENSFNVFDVAELAGEKVPNNVLIQMLFQTGYLTVDHLRLMGGRRMYTLCFPNHEVEESFSEYLLNLYVPGGRADTCADDLIMAAFEGNTEEMMEILTGFMADIPYDIQLKNELYYESIVYTIFKMCGMDTTAEVRTNKGRIDAVLQADKHLYIIEFKLNKTVDAALAQIEEKKYAEKYIYPAKKKGQVIHALGINFCYGDEVRNISDWKEVIF